MRGGLRSSSYFAYSDSRYLHLLLWKGGCFMILFTILLITLAVVVLGTIAVLGVSGIAVILPFVDVIAFVLIVVWIIRFLIKRKK